MATATINSMGTLNEKWGICGFTSALYALYEHSPRQKQKGLAPAAETETRMLAEIKTFLRMLQADNRADLLNKIEMFTRSFGGKWAAFEIDKYIERINASVKVTNPANLGDFSIAMPPRGAGGLSATDVRTQIGENPDRERVRSEGAYSRTVEIEHEDVQRTCALGLPVERDRLQLGAAVCLVGESLFLEGIRRSGLEDRHYVAASRGQF